MKNFHCLGKEESLQRSYWYDAYTFDVLLYMYYYQYILYLHNIIGSEVVAQEESTILG